MSNDTTQELPVLRIEILHPSGKGGWQLLYEVTRATVGIYWPVIGYQDYRARVISQEGEIIKESVVQSIAAK